MKGLGQQETVEYLGVLKSLRSSIQFYDTHVHPYEVLFDRFTYEGGVADSGVMSLAGKTYTTPTVKAFQFPEVGYFSQDPKSQRLQDISLMLLKKVYGTVGAQVFIDQMSLSGIDRVMLLPVAPENCSPETFRNRMRWVKQLYQDQEKFWIAGSIPATLDGAELKSYVQDQKREFGIRALKCHPVVSGIDLGTGARKEWLEELIAACHEASIPLIIHGGRNNPYWGGDRGDYAAIEHLSEVKMSHSGHPVVLAHAGLHRCKVNDVESDGLRMLRRMLEAHPNLYIDLSGLTLEPLKLVLRSVPGDRMLFGSDALYASQWEAVTLAMHAIKELGMPLEEKFVQLASINPSRTVFKEDNHAQYFQDQVASVSGGSQGEVLPGSP